MSYVAFPLKSTYCVAICPLAISSSSNSFETINLPSPCEIGTVNSSPSSTSLNHGDIFDTTFVLTIFDWCLEIVLNVKVGIVSSISLISPYGNNPNFTNAWNPLQIPNINPSFSYRCLWIKSFSFGFLKILLMNFPEPSGSSPALNPPGNMMICAFSISFANNSIESCISCGFKFLNTTVLTLAPASSNAFAESYSQFVPGNTGIKT